MVGVVVHERDFLAHVAAVLALAHLRHLRVDVSFGFGKFTVVQVALEGAVVHVKAGVDNGHQLPVALLVDLVGLGHVERGLVGRGVLHALVSGHFVAFFDEGVLHAVQVLNGFKQIRRRLNGETVNGVVVVVELLELGLLGCGVVGFVVRTVGTIGVISAQQRDALHLLLAYQVANLAFEVAVAILVDAAHDAAEQAHALRAAVLKLHDNGNVALFVGAIRRSLAHSLLNGICR